MRARGFSLIEASVAAAVLAIGLLAVIASERSLARLDLLGQRQSQATEAAAGRMAMLESQACAGAGAGHVSATIDEQWSLAAGGPLRSASVSVTFAHDGRLRTARYDALWLCP